MLVEFLRDAAHVSVNPDDSSFQVLLNTHSPKVMAALKPPEIVGADIVATLDPATRSVSVKTRMRTQGQPASDMLDPGKYLSVFELERLLQHSTDAA